MKPSPIKLFLILLLVTIVSFSAGCSKSGGSSDDSAQTDTTGGDDTTTADDDTTTTTPEDNVEGTVLDENSQPVANATVTAFSEPVSTTTDENGAFSLYLAPDPNNPDNNRHTLMISRAGCPDTMMIFEISGTAGASNALDPVVLRSSRTSTVTLNALNDDTVFSNFIDNRRATLLIPAQNGGVFNIDARTDSAPNVGVEYFDPNEPLPFPLPSPGNCNESFQAEVTRKWAPSVVVAVSPALIEFSPGATLRLPIPHPAKTPVGTRLLWFDAANHEWKDTGKTVTSTDRENNFTITRGGVYGIFQQVGNEVCTVRGSYPADSVILIGDRSYRVPSNGSVNIENVHVSIDGSPLRVAIVSGEAGGTVSYGWVQTAANSIASIIPDDTTVASVALSSLADSIDASTTAQTSIFATVKDSNGNLVADGTPVVFSTSLGDITPLATTVNGVATAILTATTIAGEVTITATVGGLSEQINVAFKPVPTYFSLSLSGSSVKTDNSDSVTVTATVLDANRVPVEGIRVSFSAGGGQLSTAPMNTDENGEANILFSSGKVEKKNQTVTITASVPAIGTREIKIAVTGTTVEADSTSSSLEIGGANQSTLTLTVKDAGGVAIYDAPVSVSVDEEQSTGDVLLADFSGNTNEVGQSTVSVVGSSAGTVVLKVESMGAATTYEYAVGVLGEVFQIIDPADKQGSTHTIQKDDFALTDDATDISFVDANPDKIVRQAGSFVTDGFKAGQTITVRGSADNDGSYTVAAVLATELVLFSADELNPEAAGRQVSVSNGLFIGVRAPDISRVWFVTTFGAWGRYNDVADSQSVVKLNDSADEIVWMAISSPDSGLASIMVSDADNPQSTRDSMSVAFSASLDEATQILLQTSTSVIPPNLTPDTLHSVTLTATVKDADDNGVGNAPVQFRILDPVNGGEYVSPPIVFTDDYGVATSTFTPGALSTDNTGITVEARIDGTAITSQTSIVIGGTAGSVVIGRSTEVTVNGENTAYLLPMSVQVADTNGNPVANTEVSLSVWPKEYRTGYWISDTPIITGFYPNEDANQNSILDPSEDKNEDGELTPPNTAGGTLPATVITDESGVASFDLVYLKHYAVWIETQITATTLVFGSETRSTMVMTLPYRVGDEKYLPSSPFNDALAALAESMYLNSQADSLDATPGSQTAITAMVLDGESRPVADGTPVTFTTTIGTITSTAFTEDGLATATLEGSAVSGTAIITATAGGVLEQITVEFVPIPAFLSLQVSGPSVKSDNSDFVTVTATVLDSNRVPIPNSPVNFEVTGGQISASQVFTDENGEAAIDFRSGTVERKNQTVTVTATAPRLESRQIPVMITGTTVEVESETTALEVDGDASTNLTVTVKDAGGIPIYEAPVTLTVDPDLSTGLVSLSPASEQTNASGILAVLVTAQSPGTAVVKIESMGVVKTLTYTVGSIGDVFRIIEPAGAFYSMHTVQKSELAVVEDNDLIAFNDNAPGADTITRSDVGGSFAADGFDDADTPFTIQVRGSAANDGSYTVTKVEPLVLTLDASDELTPEAAGEPVLITNSNGLVVGVKARGADTVVFASSFGAWGYYGDPSLSHVIEKPVDSSSGEVWAVISSPDTGLASIEVYGKNNPSGLKDTMQIAFSASVVEATQIDLQASSSVVAPNLSADITNSVNLTATVRDATDNGVGNAPVVFSIENPTGGGEAVTPVVAYTDDYGIAQAKFTSGFLSSDSSGVKIVATIVGTSISDHTNIVIGGASGSVVIGHSIEVASGGNGTTYSLPMSVLVSDTNGNPMQFTTVSLSLWPLGYMTGGWDENCGEVTGTFFSNEDKNGNLILDTGEDFNDDGMLTPPNSAAGDIPDTVVTDENGVANFNLVYLTQYARWIGVEITASTLVFGSETQASLQFILPYAIEDQCFLPASPYNYIGNIVLTPDLPPVNGQVPVTVTVFDVDGNPVYDGTRINFEAERGYPSANYAFTQNGVCEVTLIEDYDYYFDSTATLIARAESLKAEVTVDFDDSIEIKSISLANTAPAGGVSQITATLIDDQDLPVPDGVEVLFEAVGGTLSSEMVRTAGGNGEATVTLTGLAASATVTARAGNIENQITVDFPAP